MSETIGAFAVVGVVCLLSLLLTGSVLPGFLLIILAAMFG